MIPNGSAYNNFPPFATNGTKTPPGGSPESAKYALGMVPADTFPAEWANYLFHGATAGITRLNADTGSIKKEINSVLDNFNITPDGTLTDQLMTALNKLKAEAALAAHPVGSLYWTSSSENPAVTFGGGTWVQIKDRFVLAAGDTYGNGSAGGSATVSLTESNLPAHTHTMSHNHTGSVSGSVGLTNTDHTHSFSGTTGGMTANVSHSHSVPVYLDKYNQGTDGVAGRGIYYRGECNASSTNIEHGHFFSGTTGGMTANVSHSHSWSGSVTIDTITANTGSVGSGTAHENMPPYIVKYCWERTA